MIDKYSIAFSEQDWSALFHYLRNIPHVLFHDKSIRNQIVKRRAQTFGIDNALTGAMPHAIELTRAYNAKHMHSGLESNVLRLIRPLSILDGVHENAAQMRVLSCGPRTENEILLLIAHGFTPDKIDAIDCVSNSPLIEIGDVHDIAWPDDEFDVVVAGWLLPYSRNPRLALSEMVRVMKGGGLLCIGLTRVPEGHAEYQNLVDQGSAIYLSAQQILQDLPDGVTVQPLFVHEAPRANDKSPILLIVRVMKPPLSGSRTEAAPA